MLRQQKISNGVKKKKITIEDLARMVKRGFDETAKKEEVDKRFSEVVTEMKGRFDGVGRRFDAIDDRLDRIEKLILADHKKRIEKLELEVKELKELLAVK